MYGVCKRFGLPHKYTYLLGSGDACIYEVALKHHIVLHRYRHYHHRELRALALVDCYGIGQCQLVQLRDVVFNKAAVESHCQRSLIGVNRCDIADVAVEHVLVVVVADLHHLVALSISVAASRK